MHFNKYHHLVVLHKILPALFACKKYMHIYNYVERLLKLGQHSTSH